MGSRGAWEAEAKTGSHQLMSPGQGAIKTKSLKSYLFSLSMQEHEITDFFLRVSLDEALKIRPGLKWRRRAGFVAIMVYNVC